MKNRFALPLLPFRLVSFAFFQALIALLFLFLKKENPWQLSEGYWIISGLLTNLITFLVLRHLFAKEGKGFFDNFLIEKGKWGKELLIALVLMILAAPLSMLPNTWLSNILWESPEIPAKLFFRPLPVWVIYTGIIWAITQGIVELQTYFGYILPRLVKGDKSWYGAWMLSSLFLALQHITFPLIIDWKFLLWRLGMFLLFALFAGLCIKIRPRLFPFMAIFHALMDLALLPLLFQQLN